VAVRSKVQRWGSALSHDGRHRLVASERADTEAGRVTGAAQKPQFQYDCNCLIPWAILEPIQPGLKGTGVGIC